MLTVAVARSSVDENTIYYVLAVFGYRHMMVHIQWSSTSDPSPRLSDINSPAADSKRFDWVARRPRYYGAGAKSVVSDCLVVN